MDLLIWLQEWFAAQCDGDWEHSAGVRIESLDNPGWLVTIRLRGTALEKHAANRVLATLGELPSAANGNVVTGEWLECRLDDGEFRGAGDASKLGAILGHFKTWVQQQA